MTDNDKLILLLQKDIQRLNIINKLYDEKIKLLEKIIDSFYELDGEEENVK